MSFSRRAAAPDGDLGCRRRRPSDRLRRPFWLLAVVLVCVLAQEAFAQGASEAQIKAAYLISFMKYIDWPGNPANLNICLYGRETLLPLLAGYEGRSIGGRPLLIHKVVSADQLAGCQQLFIADSDSARGAEMLQQALKQPLLITGDGENFIRQGGAIALARSDGRVVFDINTDAIARAGLKAATPMLRLARSLSGGQR
ncbi:YfiR/HmsC family protein [Rhodocyclus purpureus]|uniref:YfiR/HmsC family protein n=1 Tax=Rhodocyclus purpureus TaxID=1067 RepID=UPI001911273D